MIADHLSGKLNYQQSANEGLSFRDLVHQYCRQHPWARFGNDMLLGLQADRPTTTRERQFLPCETMNDFDRAVVDGNRRLVTGTTTLVDIPENPEEGGFPLSPRACCLLLLGIVVVLTVWEFIAGKTSAGLMPC